MKDFILKFLGSEETHLQQNPGMLETGVLMLDHFNTKLCRQIFNTYPRGYSNRCPDSLIVAIGRQDNLKKTLSKVKSNCNSKMYQTPKLVIFWAAQWDENLWQFYKTSFQNVDDIVLKRVGKEPVNLQFSVFKQVKLETVLK